MHDDLRTRLDGLFPSLRRDYEELLRIPSISAEGFPPVEVERSAEAVASMLETSGYGGVRLLRHGPAHPAVFGELAGPPGAPTILLYAHHDVQPPGDGWVSDPFEPVERDGRLYGRGTSDDKCGVALHLASGRLFDGNPPVTMKVMVEGEEEIGSPHLPDFLAEHGELLAADVIVIADSANWRTGQPAFTTSLRGLVDCVVEVRTLAHAVHSGMYGGVFPDALTVLSRLLATLHHPDGTVAVEGLVRDDAPPLDLTEEELREQAGTVPGLAQIGSGTLTSRLWRQPAVAVLAIDAPRVPEAINALTPSARAKVSLRLAPSDDPARALAALTAHLEANAPWGAEVTVAPGALGEAFSLDTGGPAYEAFGTGFREAWEVEPLEIGVGGSIPFVAAFSDAYPQASIMLTGVADQLSRAHGPNESVDLGELQRGCLAQAIALAQLGG